MAHDPDTYDYTDDVSAISRVLSSWFEPSFRIAVHTAQPEIDAERATKAVIEDAAGEIVDILRARWFNRGPLGNLEVVQERGSDIHDSPS